ncbi:hypothetical protein LNV09_07445 [Paucibacter sp. B2R-40]|uniref:hypothetical protein n=1 Tax=Paucibacter sp. B2R-40 TaxID=2893554 RepID=UPI0021E35D08|nr:hypothetical protein [Paucibacter sp. B2R-40]MCV2354000.1 hypothetical protein [Paucibacter sp. B2R-40]
MSRHKDANTEAADPDQEPWPALGPKTAELHARRLRLMMAQAARASNVAEAGGHFALTSEDGRISFLLQASAVGLYLEHHQWVSLTEQYVQCMIFESSKLFTLWCDSDSIRFEHPILFGQLKRLGGDIHHADR